MALVRVFATADPIEGKLLASRLESEDIPVLLKGGDAPYHLGPVYLFVPAEDEIRARLFIDAVRDGALEQGPPDLDAARSSAKAMLELLDADLDAGRISEHAWYESVADVITAAYLATDDPRAQSGHRGDETHWEHARSLLVDAIDRDGTFLDVGCANGYLMESLARWSAARGRRIEPFGLEISPELAALARHRLPDWAERIHVGNVIDWRPPMRFDFVRTGLEYVPHRRRQELLGRLLDEVVAPGGRLIIGVFNEYRDLPQDEPTVEETVASWSFVVSGRAERPHFVDERRAYRTFWIDAGGRDQATQRLEN
jgi:SAM-dependent methyltransferase